MVAVEHACNAVKSESIEPVGLQPIADVAKEEALHFVFAVIKASRIPCGVVTSLTGVEIVVCRAVKAIQAFIEVFDGVAVDQIHDNQQTHTVCGINQGFEFFGGPETA